MTLVDLFNSFHDACRKVTLTSDARSLFLAFMQHWNQQRRPQALDISLTALRTTAGLNEDSYRRAAICLSNLKFWRMKRKAHDKQGRFIYIGDFFLDQKTDRREIDADPAFSAPPPTPPSERQENPALNGGFSATEIKTEPSAREQEKPRSGFSVNFFRGRDYRTLPKEAIIWLQNEASPEEYDKIICSLA